MSKGRLTRQELGWLLTQQAQGAAERLRKGVQALTTTIPPPAAGSDAAVDDTLTALDDAMRMLSGLHARPINGRGRRGRIDVASLLWEVAPEARVSIEPGSGTEVFGDEAELRRMLHVLLGHGGGNGSAVTIRREGDDVRVSVTLGPDSSATADTERAWIGRMAIRYGGSYELIGGTEVLTLPADGVDERDEKAQLRKELDEARRQGEAYARELAQVVATNEEGAGPSSWPPPMSAVVPDRVWTIARLSGAIAAQVRSMIAPVSRELHELRAAQSSPKGGAEKAHQVDLEPVSERRPPTDTEERLEAIRKQLVQVQEFVQELSAVSDVESNEPPVNVDIAEVVRAAAATASGRAERAGVTVSVSLAGDDQGRIKARVPPRAAGTAIRLMVGHAIDATPRGGEVSICVTAAGAGEYVGLGVRITIDDAGTTLPAGARRTLLTLEAVPSTFGRPSAIPLFLAGELASSSGAMLELSDPPGASGGVRAVLTFPR